MEWRRSCARAVWCILAGLSALHINSIYGAAALLPLLVRLAAAGLATAAASHH
jgi:hypothetical protein